MTGEIWRVIPTPPPLSLSLPNSPKLEFLPDGDDRSESTLRAGDLSGGKQASERAGKEVGEQSAPTTLMEREKRLEGQMPYFNLALTNRCMYASQFTLPLSAKME